MTFNARLGQSPKKNRSKLSLHSQRVRNTPELKLNGRTKSIINQRKTGLILSLSLSFSFSLSVYFSPFEQDIYRYWSVYLLRKCVCVCLSTLRKRRCMLQNTHKNEHIHVRQRYVSVWTTFFLFTSSAREPLMKKTKLFFRGAKSEPNEVKRTRGVFQSIRSFAPRFTLSLSPSLLPSLPLIPTPFLYFHKNCPGSTSQETQLT